MKKIIYLAAACAALAACNITDMDNTAPSEGIAFEKGQQVTLTVMAGEKTKANGTLDDSGNVNFKWEAGDVIKVTVGGTPAEFTVSKLIDGGTSAEFVGTMPESGTTFDAQFPYDTPTLTTQEYVENGVPHNMVLASKTGCTIGTPFKLEPQYAVLRLNLYGLERKVTQIVVTDNTTSGKPTYTLTCNESGKIGSTASTATSFLIVVNKGSYQFNASVTSEAVGTVTTPGYPTNDLPNYGSGILVVYGNFSTSSAKTFTAGKVLNMPAKCITNIWAPVNCGYDATHPYGLYYQFGRKDGSGGTNAEGMQTEKPAKDYWTTDGCNKTPRNDFFYAFKWGENGNTEYDWYTNTVAKQLSEWPMTDPSGTTGIGNPCPNGWRVPTRVEYDKLIGGDGTCTFKLSFSSFAVKDGINGHWLNGTATPPQNGSEGIFLPAAGCRSFHEGMFNRNSYGYYWASSVNGKKAEDMDFSSNLAYTRESDRSYAFTIRCVEDENAVYPGATLPGDMPNVPVSW